MTSRTRHLLATVGLPLLSIAALAIYLAAIQGDLPDRTAIHWGPGGEADGFAEPRSLFALFPGLALAVGGLLAVISLTSARTIAGRPLPGMANGLVWFLAALAVATTAPQLDGTNDASLPGWAIAVAVAAGVAGWGLAMAVAGPQGAPPETEAPAPADAARLDLTSGHTAIWAGRAPAARIPLVLAAAVAALGVVLAVVTTWWIVAILLPVAALLVGSSSYRITIGPRAVDVSGALLGHPRLRVPLATISRADVGEVDAWSFGGWGIRVGANRESAVITRSGPALVITRTDGAILRVSLDEPEAAAATLTTLLDRRGLRPATAAESGRC